MNMIHVNRDRQNLGQFTPEEIAAGLASGRFLPTDLAWREGMESWQLLSTFTDLPLPSEAATPILAPGSPIADAAITPAVPTPAWERESGSVFHRVWETIREVLSDPRSTFASMPLAGGLRNPLVFLILVQTICYLVSLAYSTAFEVLKPRTATDPLTLQMTLYIYAGLAIFMPLLIIIGSFINAGILHLCLMLVGAAPKSFEATYRVIAYAGGATSVFLLIPICGGLVQLVWNIYTVVVGFREVHATTTGKAVFAVLLPIIVCCTLGIGFSVVAAMIPTMIHAKG